MTDRELLQAAAKAAGIELTSYCTKVAICYYDKRTCAPWNPLEHDGDVLRLAVKLNLQIFPHDMPDMAVCSDGGDISAGEPHQGDPYCATRRAIVRAAAAVWARQTDIVPSSMYGNV